MAALSRNLAAELGPHGIRVNALNADFVDTPLMRRLIEQRAALKGITADSRPRSTAGATCCRSAPSRPPPWPRRRCSWSRRAPRYTTGAALPIDGGIKEAMPR